MNGLRLLLLSCVALAGCATTTASDWTRFSDGSLNEWLGDSAVPALRRTLSEHPRFRNEKVHVAVLDGEKVAVRTSGLAVAVREAVHSALLDSTGANVLQLDGPPPCGREPRSGYYLAVSATASGKRGSVQLRLYDVVEQQWVAGFAHQWRGELSANQRDAARRSTVAGSAAGLREKPFTAGQSDLLAGHLATELACRLLQSGDDETGISPARGRSASLIAGNLARHDVHIVAGGDTVLDTRIHQVDDNLYQVWAILTPTGESGLAALAVSAYATEPLLPPSRNVAAAPGTLRPAPVALLSPLDVVSSAGCDGRRGESLGGRPVIEPGSCFGLAFDADPEARVFVVNHQVDGRLVRLHPSRCDHVSPDRPGPGMTFPSGPHSLAWDERGGTETFYVIAARSGRESIAGLLARLPDRCDAPDSGFDHRRWLRDVDRAIRERNGAVAWEAVRVYHQPSHTRLGQY